MNLQMVNFALNQVLASFVAIGPLIVLIGLVSLQERKRNHFYVAVGVMLTALGAYFLYVSLMQRHGESFVTSDDHHMDPRN